MSVPADEKIGPGDRWILESVREACPNTTLMGIVTKTDKCPRRRRRTPMELHALLGPEAELVPVSSNPART